MNAEAAMDELTPPQYGEHQFDQLYSEIDPAGYITPAGGPSGMNTPFQSRSRSVSSENLASLAGVAANELTGNILQSRLNSLAVTNGPRIIRDRTHDRSQLTSSGDGQGEQGDESGTSLPVSLARGSSTSYLSAEGSRQILTNGDSVSRRASEEDDLTSGSITPQHIEYSAENLAKVPSYTTALQSKTRTPVNSGLPTYQSATSTTSSALARCIPRIPSQVHVQQPIENHRDMLRRCS